MIAQILDHSFLVKGASLTFSNFLLSTSLTSSSLNGFLPTSPNEAFPPITNHAVSRNKSAAQTKNVPPNPIAE